MKVYEGKSVFNGIAIGKIKEEVRGPLATPPESNAIAV